jgi:hypothetical protein
MMVCVLFEKKQPFFPADDSCDATSSCGKALNALERIDPEADQLGISFVKVHDPRYAKKYGVTKLPALVYFRKKFPSVYRGKMSFLFLSVQD